MTIHYSSQCDITIIVSVIGDKYQCEYPSGLKTIIAIDPETLGYMKMVSFNKGESNGL